MTSLINCPVCESLVLSLKKEYKCRNCGSMIFRDWRRRLIVKRMGFMPLNELQQVQELGIIPEDEVMIKILKYVHEHPGSTIDDIILDLGTES